MASPLSVGDVLALAKLALTLGRAFTKGRASAPAEFRDIESQLYSLGAALDALTSIIPDSGGTSISAGDGLDDESQEPLLHSIRSCESTIKHLESVVSEYAVLRKKRDETAIPARFKRWNNNLAFVWKSIKWTTEGGDLMALRSNLTVHTNSLNLLLGVKLHTRIDKMHLLLREINSWRDKSLRDPSPSPPDGTAHNSIIPGASQPSFVLCEVKGDEDAVVCGHAVLVTHLVQEPESHHGPVASENDSLFCCACPSSGSENVATLHNEQLGKYTFSPLSFCVRIPGNRRIYMLYKMTNQNTTFLTTLLIKVESLQGVADLHDYLIGTLALRQARTLLRRNVTTMLCYPEIPELGAGHDVGRANVLNLTSGTPTIRQRIKAATFNQGRFCHVKSSIETVQLLHYKDMDIGDLMCGLSMADNGVRYQRQPSLSYFIQPIRQTTNPTTKKIEFVGHQLFMLTNHALPVQHDTLIEHAADQASITFNTVDCIGYDAAETPHRKEGVQVILQFYNNTEATELHAKIEQMCLELFVIHFQYPRPSETILLKILTKNLHTEHFHITSATITILRDTVSQRVRLLITGAGDHMIVSQDLTETFLQSLAASSEPSSSTEQDPASTTIRPNFRFQTYVVRTDDTGRRRILNYTQGFSYLDFSDAKIDKLFQIGLAAVADSDDSLNGTASAARAAGP